MPDATKILFLSTALSRLAGIAGSIGRLLASSSSGSTHSAVLKEEAALALAALNQAISRKEDR